MDRPLKILFFYQYFGTPNGSWSTRVYELTRQWVAVGHRVTVVTAPYEKSDIQAHGFISRQKIEGIELIVVDSGDSNRIRVASRVWRALRFAFVSIWYALNLKADVVIASSGPITIGLPLIFSRIFRGKKTIFEVRDLWPAGGIEVGLINKGWQKKIALWFERLCYKKSDLVVCSSVGQRNHIIARFPKLNIDVIPNASDLELFGEIQTGELPSWTEGKRLVTHIGSLGLLHNVNYWIDVAVEVQKISEEVIFVFIGAGVERDELESRIQEERLSNFYFLGLKPKVELPLWVQKSKATLFATLNNPVQDTCSPNKIFDSFASGVPIIQTSNGWIGDLVEHEKCGINLPLSDIPTSARLLTDFVQDDERCKEYGLNANKLARGPFNRKKLAMKYLEHITNIAGK